MTETTLPAFRIGGLAAQSDDAGLPETAAALHRAWQNTELRLPAFSQTLYCAFRREADGRTAVLLGRLLPPDAALPDNAAEMWLPPQQYAVRDWADGTDAAAAACLADGAAWAFASYPVQGGAKLYLGRGAAAFQAA